MILAVLFVHVQIVHIYRLHRHTCCLYLGSVLVDEYGDEPNFVPPLLEMLQVRHSFFNHTSLACR